MKRCITCRRHVRRGEPSCPFCGVPFVSHATLAAVALTVGVAGCGPERGLEDAGAAETDGGSTTRSDSAGAATSTDPDSTTSGTDPDTTAATDTDEPTTSAGFIYGAPDDGGVSIFECDVWSQDCPDGRKCAPWDNTGQGAWNATKCVPVDPVSAPPGEPCHVEGSGTSGIDDCALGAICWKVDPDTLEGTCVAQCQGTEANPSCPDDLACSITHAGALTLCLQACSPILQDCPPGEACHGIGDVFVCVPQASGTQGGHGQPCDEVGVCDPGFFCADASFVPECQDGEARGCCSSHCDLSDPEPDATCAAFSPTLVCTPWFEPGTAPEGYEHGGACVAPD
jgi:hypothetical protein